MRGCDNAADEYALNQTEDQEHDRRGDAGLRDRRQHTEGRGADPDADDRDHHRALSTMHIGVMAEYRGADRTHQQRHRKRCVYRGKREGRMGGREKQRTNDRRDIEQNKQIEQIERPAEHGSDDRIDHLSIAAGRLRVRQRRACDCHFESPSFFDFCNSVAWRPGGRIIPTARYIVCMPDPNPASAIAP